MAEPRWKRLARKDDEYVLVLRRRGRSADPTWLKPYQARMTAATRQAAQETQHLTGVERRLAMQRRTAQLLRETR